MSLILARLVVNEPTYKMLMLTNSDSSKMKILFLLKMMNPLSVGVFIGFRLKIT